MPEEDDFASQIASLDRGQLNMLLAELQDRGSMDFSFDDPTSNAPQQYMGAGLPPSLSAMSDMSMKEKFRQGAGRLSVVGQYKHYKRSKKAKKAKKAYHAALGAESARQKQILAERLKMVQGQVRTMDMRDKVNQQFRDLDLEGLFDRITKEGLEKNVLGITQGHEDLTRQSGFQTVSQGLGGGSADAERIADIQSSQDTALAQVASSAQLQRRQLGDQAEGQRRTLLDSVSGTNPGEEARLTGELDNIRNQAGMFEQQAQTQGWGMQQDASNLAGQSQAIGGLLSSYADLYNTNRSY